MVPYPLWANIFTEHFHPNPNACSYVPHEISTLLNSMEGARGCSYKVQWGMVLAFYHE